MNAICKDISFVCFTDMLRHIILLQSAVGFMSNYLSLKEAYICQLFQVHSYIFIAFYRLQWIEIKIQLILRGNKFIQCAIVMPYFMHLVDFFSVNDEAKTNNEGNANFI